MRNVFQYFIGILAIFSFLSLSANTNTNGKISFEHGNWDEVLSHARMSQQPIFVQTYADYCLPCKVLDRAVLTDPEIISFFNSHFINYRVDMTSSNGGMFSVAYGVEALPTLLFLDAQGKIVEQVIGYKTKDELLWAAKSSLGIVPPSSPPVAIRVEERPRAITQSRSRPMPKYSPQPVAKPKVIRKRQKSIPSKLPSLKEQYRVASQKETKLEEMPSVEVDQLMNSIDTRIYALSISESAISYELIPEVASNKITIQSWQPVKEHELSPNKMKSIFESAKTINGEAAKYIVDKQQLFFDFFGDKTVKDKLYDLGNKEIQRAIANKDEQIVKDCIAMMSSVDYPEIWMVEAAWYGAYYAGTENWEKFAKMIQEKQFFFGDACLAQAGWLIWENTDDFSSLKRAIQFIEVRSIDAEAMAALAVLYDKIGIPDNGMIYAQEALNSNRISKMTNERLRYIFGL